MSQTACWATNELDVCAKVYFGYGSHFDMIGGYPGGYQLSLRGVIAFVRCDMRYTPDKVKHNGQYIDTQTLEEYLGYPMASRMGGSPIHIEHPDGQEAAMAWYKEVEKNTGLHYYTVKPSYQDLQQGFETDWYSSIILGDGAYRSWYRWLDQCGEDGAMVKRAEYMYEQASAANDYISTTGISRWEKTKLGKKFHSFYAYHNFEDVAYKKIPRTKDPQKIAEIILENFNDIYGTDEIPTEDGKEVELWEAMSLSQGIFSVEVEDNIVYVYLGHCWDGKRGEGLPEDFKGRCSLVMYDLNKKYKLRKRPAVSTSDN